MNTFETIWLPSSSFAVWSELFQRKILNKHLDLEESEIYAFCQKN